MPQQQHLHFFLTHLGIERHAATVYTREIFLMVQKEIYKGVWFCSQKSVVSEGVCEICTIKHKQHQVIAEYEVCSQVLMNYAVFTEIIINLYSMFYFYTKVDLLYRLFLIKLKAVLFVVACISYVMGCCAATFFVFLLSTILMRFPISTS